MFRSLVVVVVAVGLIASSSGAHAHAQAGNVYAYLDDLQTWLTSGSPGPPPRANPTFANGEALRQWQLANMREEQIAQRAWGAEQASRTRARINTTSTSGARATTTLVRPSTLTMPAYVVGQPPGSPPGTQFVTRGPGGIGGVARVGSGVRLAGAGARAFAGPIGWTLLGGQLIWTGYREVFPPPNWDWAEEEDSKLDGVTYDAGGVGPPVSMREVFLDPALPNSVQGGPGSFTNFSTVYWGDELDPAPRRVVEGWSVVEPEDAANGIGSMSMTLRRISGEHSFRFYALCAHPEYLLAPHTVAQSLLQANWGVESPNVRTWSYTCSESRPIPVGLRVTGRSADSKFGWVMYRGGNIITPEARVVGEVTCDDGVTTPTTVRLESDWYQDHDDRPDLRPYGCLEGQQLVGLAVFVEYSDGTVRYLLGGPLGQGDEGLASWGADESTDGFLVLPNLADSPYTGADQRVHDGLDHDDDAAVVTVIDVDSGRMLEPDLDAGWQYDPDRESQYACVLLHPVHGAIEMPLAECSDLAWQPDEAQEQQEGEAEPRPVVIPPPVTVPIDEGDPFPADDAVTPSPDPNPDPNAPPDPDPNDDHALESPTQDGLAPGFPYQVPSRSCIQEGREGGGIGSFIVFVGVACALEWAFVPSPELIATITETGQDAAGRAPFSYPSQIAAWVEPLGELPDDCLHIALPVEGWGTYDVIDACAQDEVSTVLTTMRPFLAVAFYGSLLLPLVWWAWRQYAPGTKGHA